ncbi:MAG: aminoglycoside phosphotransferase family protein [Pseudomonadota bacterium]
MSAGPDGPPAGVLATFGATDPVPVADTAIALVWKVRTANGAAALKLYKPPGMGKERAGFDYLRAADGAGAARVLGLTEDAALTEWLPGPSLGDLVRTGEDRRAAAELLAVSDRLRAASARYAGPLPRLETWFESLLTLRFAADCPAPARRDVERAQMLARALLADQRAVGPMHGDLHQDNVRFGRGAFRAFDAKGVVGDRGYELANAFRNPVGADRLMRRPERVRMLRDLWSRGVGTSPRRLMGWAAAKAALSIAWRSGPVLSDDPDLDLLGVLLAVWDETPAG